MKKITCILIDDEPLARKGLLEYISEIDFLESVSEFASVPPAPDWLQQNNTDLIFLDIEMPKMTGLEMLRVARDLPTVVLITAYPQHALEGYEWNVLDYLVKPVSFERFYKTALRASDLSASSNDHFFIKVDGRIVRINLADLLFVEAMQNYVVLHTSQKKYITYLTFKAVEEHLPPERFIRTHKSFVVAADRIESIEGNLIRMAGHELPISRTLKDDVLKRLLSGKFLKR